MKILHTSDLHLIDNRNERWDALIEILEIANQQQVELTVISGDLFDNRKAGESLRTEIRHLFSQKNFTVVLIPGNHDMDVYGKGLYFGDNVEIISDHLKPLRLGQLDIWGLPYQKMEKYEVQNQILKIEEIIDREKVNILLFHGELLDARFISEDYGNEVTYRYMPIKLDYFKDSCFDYILGGHFHTQFDVRTFNNNGYFVYPGSPVSITRKEVGRRKVNLFELGHPPQEYILKTFHYTSLEVNLNPLDGIDPYNLIADKLNEVEDEENVILNIGGYYNSSEFQLTEQELIEKIQSNFKSKLDSLNCSFKDVKYILDNDLYLKFQNELSKRDIPGLKNQKLIDIFIDAMGRIDL